MVNNNPSDAHREIERRLAELYQGAPPDPAFANRLEAQLRARAAELVPQRKASWLTSSIRRPAWVFALALALALILLLAALGPEQVLAEFQRLIGYIPGVGFVDREQARVLPEPVAITQDGVTLQVDQLVAEPDQTTLLYTVIGSPAEHGRTEEESFPEIYLLLPDGEKLNSDSQSMYNNKGEVAFPPIPAGVDQATLVIDRLPYHPPGSAPEGWQVPLRLELATTEHTAQVFPMVYTPPQATATANGVTMQILAVAQGEDETAILAQFQWHDHSWKLENPQQATLIDDLGHIYGYPQDDRVTEEISVEPPNAILTPAAPYDEETFRFSALSTLAQKATFTIDRVVFALPGKAGLLFDPGEAPQDTQTWKMNEQVEAGGVKLQFTAARYFVETNRDPDDPYTLYYLEFHFTPEKLQGMRMEMISLGDVREARKTQVECSVITGECSFSLGFEVPPQHPISIPFKEIWLGVPGPWQVSWGLPHSGKPPSGIRLLHPEDAQETNAGVTLGVETVTLTDRLTSIQLAAPNLPAGTRVEGLQFRDPRMVFLYSRDDITLKAPDGALLASDPGVRWEGDEGEMSWTFGPPPEGTQFLTLHIPGVTLSLPSEDSFEVEVPDGLEIRPEYYSVELPEDREEGPSRTLMRFASQHWAVDIPVKIAGYEIHLREAYVERVRQLSERYYRLVLIGVPVVEEQGGRWLDALRFGTITRPDGAVQETDFEKSTLNFGAFPQGGVQFEAGTDSNRVARLEIDVTTQEGNQILPGVYHVELSGVTVYVPGPWELTFGIGEH